MKARPRLGLRLDSKAAWSDERLVRRCLRGDEDAWSALIDKYKRLIYSIPIRYRAGPDDAADIFQAVCLDLFEELPRLRKVESLRSWLITVAVRKCLHRKERQIDAVSAPRARCLRARCLDRLAEGDVVST
jgi:RNA polymerase sigma factor (sigma-70 family)